MTKVMLKVQQIKQAYEEAIEIQRQNFRFKLEKLEEKLEIVDSRSVAFETEIQMPKTRKQILKIKLAQSIYIKTLTNDNRTEKKQYKKQEKIPEGAHFKKT